MDKPRHPQVIRTWKVERIRKPQPPARPKKAATGEAGEEVETVVPLSLSAICGVIASPTPLVRRASRQFGDSGFCSPCLLLVSFFTNKFQETMLMVGRFMTDDPQFIRFHSQVTFGTPYWLVGTHGNLLVLFTVILFTDGF